MRSTERVSVFDRLSPIPLHHCLLPSAGVVMVVVTVLSGSATTSACLSLVLYSATPSLVVERVAAAAVP